MIGPGLPDSCGWMYPECMDWLLSPERTEKSDFWANRVTYVIRWAESLQFCISCLGLWLEDAWFTLVVTFTLQWLRK